MTTKINYSHPKAKSEFVGYKEITSSQLNHHLLGFPANKATGTDNMSSKILKMAVAVILDSLTYIFNQAMTLCSFLLEWNMGRVLPLFKNGC